LTIDFLIPNRNTEFFLSNNSGNISFIKNSNYLVATSRAEVTCVFCG